MIKSEIVDIIIPHPGIYVKDAIEELGISQNEFAIRANITSKVVSTLINGQSNITFEVATKLAAFFDNSPETWMNLQTAYETYILKEKEKEEINKEWELVRLIDKNFLHEYCDVNFEKENKEAIIKSLREKFMVGTLTSLRSPDLFSFCRTSIEKEETPKQMFLKNVWISLAYKKSQTMKVNEYNKEKLVESIKEIKKYTLLNANKFTPLLIEKLSSAGIKYVELPYLKGSNISGVTRWIPNESAIMVAINDCGKDADKIWFTLFHELGHALFNHKRHLTISYNDDTLDNEEEKQANAFAENALINGDNYYKFINKKDFSISAIKNFASSEEVAPFVIVGRLQKDGFIKYGEYEELKKKYTC